ncbi:MULTISPECIES: ABC transporter ATP-binding protein [unclassified Herbaspirillum]|uniref:ABC transporter ATP-binding protein n=1 Tax=unclassified Herbaspirillum TaxID=2624150 RepID=UPI00114E9F0A|nr:MULTISPECIES: ABC transporter ATP-binding protein [unclassified Herbaspirillum]MBB5391308.1 branched-chain amino acid transport system ATP-binding protein [Herbaspirillum sp. SJZ102]TQK13005.1 amino acid/amide ABC transporter ATP-binding protein 2 (HAAT family) [Herbaspirillum sp. SJZ130]TQK15009.1 amino acid/amide ABC transporter ATP-binding protein 2 (HAAT family) [Herbaspirillum sp. SJZ106]TWC67365.1 amino acid/amide ABC transporter ATP-binding protein 2 (HAAT family) [Herbaspirillum sp. 
MLSLHNVTGGYGRRTVLDDISLQVRAGETVAILGANTAGKTSLMRAILGLLPRCSGRIEFGSKDISSVPAHRRVEHGLACVPEGRHVFADMTVQDNLLLGGYHRRRQIEQRDIEDCFRLFPRLQERQLQKAGTLSGGEQQMVAIGRALMSRPAMLLLDEPSHGLAPLMVAEVHAAISEVNQRGISVLLVEQNVAAALKIVSRGYVLEAGRIAVAGTTAELASNDDIRRTYLGI